MRPPHTLSVVSSTYRSLSRFPPSLVREHIQIMKHGWKTSHEFQPISIFSGKDMQTSWVFLSNFSFFPSKTLPNFRFQTEIGQQLNQIRVSHPEKAVQKSQMSTFPANKNSKKQSTQTSSGLFSRNNYKYPQKSFIGTSLCPHALPVKIRKNIKQPGTSDVVSSEKSH